MSDDDTGQWRETLAGDNTERLEALQAFETQDAFLNDHFKEVNWRDDFAGDDDKFKSELERYSTPADLAQSWREQKAKISGGQYDKPPGEESTEDDVKAYREANNIPLEAAGYMDNLPDGLVIGDDDKEIMGDFMGVLHKMNVSPEVGHAVIEWYNGFAQSEQDALAETDAVDHKATEDELRVTWGSDYRANINLAGAFLESQFGAEIKEILLNARDANGRAIMNIPGVLEGYANASRQLNPMMQLVSNTGGDPQATLDDEIAGIVKVMKEERPRYNSDEKMQARLRQLYDIRSQAKEKAGAAA